MKSTTVRSLFPTRVWEEVSGDQQHTKNVREKIEGRGKWDYYKMTAMREQYHPQLWWALERYVGADAWVQSSAEKLVTDSNNARDELGQTSHRWRRPTVRCDTKWWVGIRHITMQMMALRKNFRGTSLKKIHIYIKIRRRVSQNGVFPLGRSYFYFSLLLVLNDVPADTVLINQSRNVKLQSQPFFSFPRNVNHKAAP